MSIPDDIRSIRREKYLKANPNHGSEATTKPEDLRPDESRPDDSIDESLNSAPNKIAQMEQDEKLARLLANENIQAPSDTRPPEADKVMRLMDPLPMQHCNSLLGQSHVRPEFRLKQWRCYLCRGLNLTQYKTCMHCGR